MRYSSIFTKIFMTGLALSLVGLAACGNKAVDGDASDRPVVSAATTENAKPLEGCAAAANQDNKLCHLVMVGGSGEATIGSTTLKGRFADEFDAEGHWTKASLFGDQSEAPFLVSELSYDEKDQAHHRILSGDINLDGAFDSIDNVEVQFDSEGRIVQEDGYHTFPTAPALNQLLTKTVEYHSDGTVETNSGFINIANPKNAIYVQEKMTVDGQKRPSDFVKFTFSVVNGISALAFFETTTNDYDSSTGRLAKTSYSNVDCSKSSGCTVNPLVPFFKSEVTYSYDSQGKVTTTVTKLDFNPTTQDWDDTIGCTAQYDEQNKTPVLFFSDEIKKLGFSGTEILTSLSCTDDHGNSNAFTFTWQPLSQAIGVAVAGAE